MQLVSPVLGVTDVEWTHVWVEVLMGMEVGFTRTPFGPICRAPKSDGTLCEQSATSSEIADFLNSILGLSGSSAGGFAFAIFCIYKDVWTTSASLQHKHRSIAFAL